MNFIKTVLEKASVYQEAGDMLQAGRLYSQILEIDPNNIDAIYNLAIISFSQNNITRSMQYLRQTIELQPNFASAHNMLGILLQNLGKYAESIKSYQTAINIDPNFAAAHYNLGNLLFVTNNLNEAKECYLSAIAIKPEYIEAINNLAVINERQNLIDQAIGNYQRILELDPEFVNAYYNLAKLYQDQRKFDSAIAFYRKTIALNPDFLDAYNNLGNILQELEQEQQALECYKKVLSIKPSHPKAINNLGTIYSQLGQFDKATDCYQKALLIQPDNANAHYNYAMNHKYDSIEDSHIKNMENLLTDNAVTGDNRIYLSYALGKAYEENACYEKAFTHLLKANRLTRETYKDYSTQNMKDLFAAIKDTIQSNNEKLLNHTGGCPDETPIFILGMPRSGTSLVEQIIASHEDVHGAGELEHFGNIVHDETRKETISEIYKYVLLVSENLPSTIGEKYISKLRELSQSKKHITDKLPNNFINIGLIRQSLPNAKIIHCVRDPMDNCFSIFKKRFSRIHKYGHDLIELGQYYLLYKDLMQFWHKFFPNTIYDISYEDLTSDHEKEIRKLLSFCNLPWDNGCLKFYNNPRPVKTASMTQVRKPIYTDSVQLWKKYENQLKPLSNILSELYK